MRIVYRISTGIAGALVGIVIAICVEAFFGDGIHFIPLSGFLIPIAYGSGLGFCFGFTFSKLVARIFGFLGLFSIESSS